MNAILKNFIAGEWVDGSGVTSNINPSNTNDVVGEYAKADKAQTEKAIAAAKAAFPAWSRSTPQERYDVAEQDRRPRSSPARKSSAGCWRARKARRCPRASAKSAAPARSSSSSPARRCG